MNKRILLFVSAVFVLACLLAACGSQPPPAPTPTIDLSYFPAEEWRTSTPEEQDMDSQLLDEMLEVIDQRSWAVDHISIIRHGFQVFDISLGTYQSDTPHQLFSCTKSVVSALIGIAIDRGYIEGVDVPLTDFFPGREIQNMDSRKQAITLENMLTMTAGFECRDSYLYEWVGLNQMYDSEDWIQYVLDLPMEYAPGTHFEYCNGLSNLLSVIVQQETGTQTALFAEEHLFGPLGITDYFWEVDPLGYNAGYAYLFLKPEDMARIGFLYLRGGYWAGEQVISSEWVNTSTTLQVNAATLQDGYGYQWWMDAAGYYMALGHRGQFIFVLPKYDMVVVFLSDPQEGNFEAPEYLLTHYIIPAAQ